MQPAEDFFFIKLPVNKYFLKIWSATYKILPVPVLVAAKSYSQKDEHTGGLFFLLKTS